MSNTEDINKNNINNPRREKGAGTLRKLPNGKYEARFRSGGYDKSVVCPTKKEANAELKKMRNRIIRNEESVSKEKLSDYMYDWLYIYKMPMVKPQTFDRLERTYISHIKDSVLGTMKLCNIVPKDLQIFINTMSQRYSFSTVKKIFEILNACLRQAVLEGGLVKNPMDAVTRPRESNCAIPTKKMEVFTEEELNKFITTAIEESEEGMPRFRYGWSFVLLLNTGIRSGELIALKWENVDIENRVIHIDSTDTTIKNRNIKKDTDIKNLHTTSSVKTKNGVRDIPLNNNATEAIIKLKLLQEAKGLKSKYVICTSTGRMVTHSNLQKNMNFVLRAAGIKHYSLHTTRHTFATILRKKNINTETVSEILGHSSPSITYNTYIHTDDEDKKSAVDVLDD